MGETSRRFQDLHMHMHFADDDMYPEARIDACKAYVGRLRSDSHTVATVGRLDRRLIAIR